MRSRFAVLGAAVFGATVASAQDFPVLHEFVPDIREEEESALVINERAEPEAIVYEGEILPEPEGGAIGAEERIMVSLPGDSRGPEEPGRRSPSYRPDRVTSLDQDLSYFEVFTPAIAPFKRVTALDSVVLSEGVPVLTVASTDSEPIAIVSPHSLPDARPRDQFWGNVVVDFRNGARVPFPSVSPESQILSLRTEPDVAVHVEKDAADNYYVVLDDEEPSAEPIRIIFLTDAPHGYFNQPPPPVPSDELADSVPPLPESVLRDALTFASELGLGRGMALDRVLSRLTEYFRSFEESETPPEDTGNIYLDLARGRLGICRHRSYAFVITALALGIPARFVQNEAHSWVEVEMATAGFLRIDLGGAAGRLEAHGADDRPRYRPRNPDPFPRPSPYVRSAARQDAMQGLRPDSAGPGAPASGGSIADRPAEPGENAEEDPATATEGEPIERAGNETAEIPTPEPVPLVLSTDRRQYEVFRGRVLSVSGRVAEPGGDGVAGMRIEVLLRGRIEQLLGVTVSHEHGWFQASFGVPPELEVGDYQLVVRTPGNDRYSAASVE